MVCTQGMLKLKAASTANHRICVDPIGNVFNAPGVNGTPSRRVPVMVTNPQLSTGTGAVINTSAVHSPSGASTVIGAGQVKVGGVTSFAVNVTTQGTAFVLPFTSVPVIVTVVVWLCSRLINVPAAGTCTKLTAPQLSLPTRLLMRSGTVIWQFAFRFTFIGAGQVKVGGWLSITSTSKLHGAELLLFTSVAITVTVVVPTGKLYGNVISSCSGVP